jgi:predicted SprT family Zn-dependent metalloprotease
MHTHFQDGLSEWHWRHTQDLMGKLLTWRQKEPKSNIELQLVDHLSKAFDIDRDKISIVKHYTMVINRADSPSFYRGSRGTPVELVINFFGLNKYAEGNEYIEYGHIANDPVIGNRFAQDEDEALLLTLGHELAHHVVHLIAHKRKLKVSPKPHGKAFKAVYRMIRSLAVNPMLDLFAPTAAQKQQQRHEKRLISKLQALKKMTEDATSNEHEAERALAHLNHLLAKHDLTPDSFEKGSKPHFIERTVPIVEHGVYKPLTHMCWSIADFCGVKALIHTNYSPYQSRHITYFGAPSDVYMAVYLSQLLPDALERARVRYQKSDAYLHERNAGVHSRTLIGSFNRGFVRQINLRLREAKETRDNDWIHASITSKELRLYRDQALSEVFSELHPSVGILRSQDSRAKHSSAARGQGAKAARSVNLNRPIEKNHGTGLVHAP